MQRLEDELATLTRLMGCELTEVTVERSSFEGKIDPADANRMSLELADCPGVTLKLAGDGQSMEVLPGNALMAEWTDWPYGCVHETFTKTRGFVRAKIVAIDGILESHRGFEYLAGVWFSCLGGFRFGFYNFADDGYVAFNSELPKIEEGMTRRVVELRE